MSCPAVRVLEGSQANDQHAFIRLLDIMILKHKVQGACDLVETAEQAWRPARTKTAGICLLYGSLSIGLEVWFRCSRKSAPDTMQRHATGSSYCSGLVSFFGFDVVLELPEAVAADLRGKLIPGVGTEVSY